MRRTKNCAIFWPTLFCNVFEVLVRPRNCHQGVEWYRIGEIYWAEVLMAAEDLETTMNTSARGLGLSGVVIPSL